MSAGVKEEEIGERRRGGAECSGGGVDEPRCQVSLAKKAKQRG